MVVKKIKYIFLFLFLASNLFSQNLYNYSIGITGGIEGSGFGKIVNKDEYQTAQLLTNYDKNTSFALLLSSKNEKYFYPELNYMQSNFSEWIPIEGYQLYKSSLTKIHYFSFNLKKAFYKNYSRGILIFGAGGLNYGLMSLSLPSDFLNNDDLEKIDQIENINSFGIQYGMSSIVRITPRLDFVFKLLAHNSLYSSIFIVEKSFFTYGIQMGIQMNFLRTKNFYIIE